MSIIFRGCATGASGPYRNTRQHRRSENSANNDGPRREKRKR
jgi:hypothetical protein